MSEHENYAQAKKVFETLCSALDKNEWHYEKIEEKLSIECEAQGDDLAMDVSMTVDPERNLVILISHMPFCFPEDKRLDATVAVCAVNNMLADGCFDYDVMSGHLFFRMTNSFIESSIGESVFNYLIFCAFKIIDDFNDKFLMLSKGIIDIEKFIALIGE